MKTIHLLVAGMLAVSPALQATSSAAAPASAQAVASDVAPQPQVNAPVNAAAPAPTSNDVPPPPPAPEQPAQNAPAPQPAVAAPAAPAPVPAAASAPAPEPARPSVAQLVNRIEAAAQPIIQPRPQAQAAPQVPQAAQGGAPAGPQQPAQGAAAGPQGPAPVVPREGILKNQFGIFLLGLGLAGVATKLFVKGLNAQKELAESAENKLDDQYRPKKKGAKDCWKNIWEKGFYVGVSLIGSWWIAHMLKQKRNGFTLQSYLIGEDQKEADKRAKNEAGHANCSHA